MSHDEIVLYYNPLSRARIAHWMLEEVGAPYRIELVRLDAREQKDPQFLRLNPMGKLPTLVHRGVVVTEAAAICTYLADAFPEAKLAPALDDPQRGTYLRWLFFAAGCIEPAVSDKLNPRTESPSSSQLGYGSYADVLDAIEVALSPGPNILGERFSAADLYLASQLVWGMMSKSIEPRPRFVEYARAHSQRPAAQRAQQSADQYAAALKAPS